MTRARRIGILALMASMLLAPTAQAYTLPKPRLMAVYFWASWCPNCKLLSPQLAQARTQARLDDADVLFVTLDLTDSRSIHQSILLAQALGIAEFMQKQGSATGYIAVLEATSKKELARFDRSSSADQMAERLRGLLHENPLALHPKPAN